MFIQKAPFQIGMKTFFEIKKVKNTVTWKYILNDLNNKESVGTFTKMNC